MSSKAVIIKKVILSGINNPLLYVEGKTNIKNVNFKIKSGSNELKIKKISKKSGTFYFNVAISQKDKVLEIYSIINNREKLIYSVKNTKIKRIINKVKGNFINTKPKLNSREIIYFNTEKIGIQFLEIVGIRKTVFRIQGTKENKNVDLKIYIDKKERKYKHNQMKKELDFFIEIVVPKFSREIELYCVEDEKSKLICKVKNKIIKRILRKVKIILEKIVSKVKKILKLIYRAIEISWIKYHFIIPPKVLKKYINKFFKQINDSTEIFYNPNIQSDYLNWLKLNEKEEKLVSLKYNPLISILIPVFNVKKEYLTECLDSILKQTYKNFEICIADDCSTNNETINILKKYEKKDKRIKVIYRKENGHISKATNTALEIATGEYIVLIDNDDTIDRNALYEFVKILNKNKNIDMIYSDEDKLDLNGKRCSPHFKPDYSPDTLLSLNYICHLTLLRTSIVKKIGGFTVGLEGAQDYDLFLRFTEETNRIYHIPKVLYHWRMIYGSTAAKTNHKSYAIDNGKKAIENALLRRNIHGKVMKDKVSNYYIVNYKLDKEPKISIIIPTRDYAEITEQCLKSIYKKTKYKNFEVLLVNNNSVNKETFKLFEKYKSKYNNFKVIDVNTEFNYSYINNAAVKKATGEYIVLLNNDTEIITQDWLNIMVGYAMQKHIGTVGVKLLYPDKTVQHAGVILGLGGVASHVYIGSSREDTGIYGRLRVPYNYSANTAACLMVKKSKFEKVNGLEEDLKVAYNDVDFCIKILVEGYYNVFLPQVELIHHESKSRGLDTTREKYLRFVKEQEYMYKKWKSKIKNDIYYNPNYSYKGWFMLNR